MRRFLRVVFGFLIAMLAAAMTEVLFAMPPAELMALDETTRFDRLLEMAGLVARAATHSAIFTAGFAPIVIVFAEWQKLRDWSYYVITGIIIAVGGFLAQFASENAAQPTIVNNYALIAFITTGAIGGLAYWLVAGHNAGRRRRPARIEVADDETADGSEVSGDAAQPSRSAARKRFEEAASKSSPLDHPRASDPQSEHSADRRADADARTAAASTDAADPEDQDAIDEDRIASGQQGGRDGVGDVADDQDGEDQPAVSKPMTSVPSAGGTPLRQKIRVASRVPETGPVKPAKA